MTESEIMKALECHEKRRCYDCPLGKEDIEQLSKSCSQMIAEIALDLINRKNAEIEKLEALSKHHQTLINMLNVGIDEARAEAIKEVFSEIENRIGVGHDILDFWDVFDELKKEMGVE